MQSSHQPQCMVCSLRVNKGSKSNLIIFKLIRCIQIQRRRSQRIISLPSEGSFRQLIQYMLKQYKVANTSPTATQSPKLSQLLSPAYQTLQQRSTLSITTHCSHNIIKQVLTKKLQITIQQLYNFCERVFEKLSRRRFQLQLVEKIVKNIHQRVVGLGGDGEGGEDGGCYNNRSSKGNNNKLRLGVTSSKNNKLRKLTTCESIKPLLESPPPNVNNNNINNNNNIVTPSPPTATATSNNNNTNNHPITTYQPSQYIYNTNKQQMAKQQLLLPLPFGQNTYNNSHFILPFGNVNGYGLIDHGIIANTTMNNISGINSGIGGFCFFTNGDNGNNLWMG